MKLIVHDLEKEELIKITGPLGEETYHIISPLERTPKRCCGCFSCWIKNPGVCILKDGYENVGELLSKCDEFIIISKCRYGEFNLPVRAIIDRIIPSCYPYFEKRKGKMHHALRSNNQPQITAYFYGADIPDEEKDLAEHRVTAMGINVGASADSTVFLSSEKELGGIRTW